MTKIHWTSSDYGKWCRNGFPFTWLELNHKNMTIKSWNFFLVQLTNCSAIIYLTVKQKSNQNAECLTYLHTFLSISSQAGIRVTREKLFASSHPTFHAVRDSIDGDNCSHLYPNQAKTSLEPVIIVGYLVFVIGKCVYNSPKVFNPKNSLKSTEDSCFIASIKDGNLCKICILLKHMPYASSTISYSQ